MKMRDTLATASYRIFPGQLNDHGTLYGGQFFYWIDDVSSISAQRYTRGPLATGSLDGVRLVAPLVPGDSLTIETMVSGAGTRSLEVFIRLIGEHLQTGERFLVGTGFSTFVVRDRAGKPLPPLEAETPFEQHLLAGYADRRAQNQARVQALGPVDLQQL